MIFIWRNIISCLRSSRCSGFRRWFEFSDGAAMVAERMENAISVTLPYAPTDMESALAGILCLSVTPVVHGIDLSVYKDPVCFHLNLL